jgi:thioredoxin 1
MKLPAGYFNLLVYHVLMRSQEGKTLMLFVYFDPGNFNHIQSITNLLLRRRRVSSVLEIQDSQFESEVYHSEKPVLVYFWASWCGPCRLVSPSINAVAESYRDRVKVVKLEVDPNPDAVSKCNVEGVPALRLIKDKEILASHEGAIGKDGIQRLLDSNLN